MTFSPKFRSGKDTIEQWLLSIAQYVLIVTVVVTPFLFLPQAQLSLGFTKGFVVLVGGLVAVIVFSLFMLRIGVVRMVAPVVLIPLWTFVLLAFASALLSGDRLDALVGDTVQIHTATFIALMALVVSATALILEGKGVIIRFFMAFSIISFVVQLWHVLRLFIGPEFLSFGIFTANTVSPLGSFNDVALFSGLIIMVSVVALQQLPLRGVAFWFVTGLVVLSLIMLMVVNFFLVWLVVGFFGLVVFLYTLTRDRLLLKEQVEGGVPPSPTVSRQVLVIVGMICAISAVFVVAGNFVGAAISTAFNVQYIEVRPSFATTLDIIGATYSNDNAILGIGPNRFEDAWRQYKNPVINETLFWNTTFVAGSGYVPTLFATMGIAGGLAFLVFLGSFLFVGYRMLVASVQGESFWYFVGTAAFTAAVYVWGMALLYVPGTAVLLLGAFFTGLTLVAYAQLMPQSLRVMNFTQNRPRAFVLIGLVMVVIIAAIASLFVMSKQFVAHVVYAQAVVEAANTADASMAAANADVALDRAYTLFPSDRYISERVQLRLGVIGELLNLQSPSENDIARFNTAAAEALRLSVMAVTADTSNPANHALLGSIYGILSVAGATTTKDSATASFEKARALDPQNPEYGLIEAQIATRSGDLAAARTSLAQSLTVKPNYIDALFLLSQIEVTEGNAEGALAATRSIVAIEPQNPVRYFQLGSLLVANRDLVAARQAFETAIALDPNFANARYLLALVHLEEGRRDEALVQLRVVQSTNSDNADLATLITQLDSGGAVPPPLGLSTPVDEPSVEVDGEGVTTTDTAPETNLIVPVNRGGEETGDAEAEAASVPVGDATSAPAE
ncbi:tetratricopeptide repeat protein [Patescibacteria group bacterium]|nr:tetratricopeptide repeat protein [Patescibacteria group bacterium]